MKACTKCGETKPLDEYHREKRTRDGRVSHCKACVSAARAEYYTANRERISARKAEYSARADVKASKAEYNAEYYKDNREAIRARLQANPHVRWEADYRRRAIKYGFEPVVESFTRDELIERHGDRCFHCGGEWSETDHYPTPVSRGGHHTLETVVPSCVPCNRWSWRSNHD